MDKRLAQAWHDDLLSGKFKQCACALHREEAEGRGRESRAGYCCLGVLSVRVAKHKAVKRSGWHWNGREWVLDADRVWVDDGEIPLAVMDAIGLDPNDAGTFIDANDKRGKTFKQIAAMIRKTYDLPEPSHG